MSNSDKFFNDFKDVIDHPKKYIMKHMEKTGQKAIGCMPLYTPEELVLAAGMFPVGVWGSNTELSKAKTYFPAFICSILQTTLENALNGEYDMLSGMMIPNYCDSLKCMGQNFKLTVENIDFIPVTVPQNRKMEAGKEFLKSQYKMNIEQLEKISGNKITDESLEKAIEVYDEHRKIMNDFSMLASKYPDVITPTKRNYVMKSAYYMDKKEHTEKVRQLMDEIKTIDSKPFEGKRVITTGIIADSEDLLKILEENNIAIVGDDIAHESRQYRTLTPGAATPMDRLAEQFANRECSTLYDPEKKRGKYIVEMAKERKADGIIFFMTKFCDPEEYDYPQMKKDFEEAGIPHVLIETDMQMKNYEQARTAIQAFSETL
ncbi:2-hydroxyacyl-CoA dehydratase [Clostridium botulinum]|uniref:phenyllactyl-CoA dehydratase subunit FldC n=1 Tax=Clostridium botulinum TaxID=1491 RepID=UPI0007E15523|nr:phenyllactyl-CoA dehydratase subunit FldC [Clostridium botulinum]KEI74402.1 phenyllactate dehydratase [Clostridium botulinum B2 331]KEI83680.1 phenyllactate dehydratase [Clostridium botulinum B2 275]MCC5438996.1 2-hydroxyacyl-CoA dehydratase family protein [Clostridium botulinum]NFA91520.1 2-hydroxyacyl-CoA dehydratase [Clostridium botulinum]NFB21079.1 2-hydroxyacyl-CoA dehydratase [Clostridium botulinum]